MASAQIHHRLLSAATALALLMSFTGCQSVSNAPKNIGDYLNLRNGFLDPSQVGRFDKGMPWGTSKPVTWPILDQLDVVDETVDRWTSATDPLPTDIVTDTKEYVVGEGDQLRISVFELVTPGMEYYKEVTVNELGKVTLQNLGQVHIAGLSPSQIEEKIGQIAIEMGFLLPKGGGNGGPQVSVTLLQSRARIFSILGQVSSPGTYNIIGTDFRLLDALALARDIAGGTTPGLDYVYVIRQQKGAGVIPAATPADIGVPSAPKAVTPTPATNPLDALDSIERGGAKPATTLPAPASPGTEGPRLIRELPHAVVMTSDDAVRIAQADLDAALGGRPAAGAPGAPAPAAAPVDRAGFVFKDGKWVEVGNVPPATAPSAPATDPARLSAPLTAADPATPVTPALPATAGEATLNQAIDGATQRPGYIFVDGKWVEVGNPAARSGMGPGNNMSTAEAVAAATGVTPPRVIRIPLNALKEGVAKYNIIIRPGDVINVPNIEPGEFYMLGHVSRPGVYSTTGRKVTLKQAVAAAGGLDGLAIPRRCELIRRIGTNQEVTVQVDLQRIFDGEQPDIFLKSNDLVNVGTDLVAPFLAVTRNAYRASYGWGFIYDRNFFIQPTRTLGPGEN